MADARKKLPHVLFFIPPFPWQHLLKQMFNKPGRTARITFDHTVAAQFCNWNARAVAITFNRFRIRYETCAINSPQATFARLWPSWNFAFCFSFIIQFYRRAWNPCLRARYVEKRQAGGRKRKGNSTKSDSSDRRIISSSKSLRKLICNFLSLFLLSESYSPLVDANTRSGPS